MNTSSTRAKQADRGHVVMSCGLLYFQVVYSNASRVGSNMMKSKTLQQTTRQPLIRRFEIHTHLFMAKLYILQNCVESIPC